MKKLLNEDQVRKAREMLKDKHDLMERLNKLTYDKIGKEIGVAGSVIRDIHHGITYNNVGEIE